MRSWVKCAFGIRRSKKLRNDGKHAREGSSLADTLKRCQSDEKGEFSVRSTDVDGSVRVAVVKQGFLSECSS